MIGRTLGHYEILEPLGAGGMGEVYRARDTKLERDVAIKVLPEDFASDQDRLARFEREAKLLASLNHPNIAAIYGLEDDAGQRFIVMEVVEGETLQQRLQGVGRLPVDEALAVARQIAEGLEAAHDSGVIHRDLKPANVQITADGKVKVLDFGLAKAHGPDGQAAASSPDLSHSPTMAAATRTGVIMGTAAYMSPEQAKGKVLDKRTDIWSFGCVLYELLAGESAFGGEDVSDTLAAILKDEPDWSALPAELPPAAGALLRRCLRKDVARRLHDIADARIEIEDAAGEGAGDAADPAATPGKVASWAAVIAVGVVALVVGALLSQAFWGDGETREPAARESNRLEIVLPEGVAPRTNTLYPDLAISRDGRYVVFGGRGEGDDANRPYRRDLRDGSMTPIPGAERGNKAFFSPDGESIGYFSGGSLFRVPTAGGTPRLIVSDLENTFGAAWGSRGTIVYNAGPTEGLFEVSADGGEPKRLTEPNAHRYPSFLPDGRHVLFTDEESGRGRNSLALLDTETGECRTLLDRAKAPRYVASGHIIFGRGAGIYAVRFDADTLQVGDTVVPVLPDLGNRVRPPIHFGVSDTGLLVSMRVEDRLNELITLDMSGNVTPLGFAPALYVYPRYSPDGTKIAVNIRDFADTDIWVADPADNSIQRLTNVGSSRPPMWTHDGARVAFRTIAEDGDTPTSNSWRAADGSDALQPMFPAAADGEVQFAAQSFSKDGNVVVGGVAADRSATEWGIGYKMLETPTETHFIVPPRVGVETYSAAVSPDGKWLLYVSSESGGREAFVVPFEGPGGAQMISGAADDWTRHPHWSPDGSKIYYLQDNRMWVAAVTTDPVFAVTSRTPLFRLSGLRWSSGNYTRSNWGLAPDGESFLMIRGVGEPQYQTHLGVVINLFDELKRLLPGPRRR